MRTAAVSLVLVLVLAAAAQVRHAPQKPARPAMSAEDTIKTLEEQWLVALIQRDQATVASILAPEFHDTGVDGAVHDRQQALAAVVDTTRPALNRSFGRLDASVFDGRFAVAWGTVIITGPQIHARVSFTDAFVLRDGHWLAVAAQETLASGL